MRLSRHWLRSTPISNDSMHLIVTSPFYNLGKVNEQKTTMEWWLAQQTAVITEAVRLLHPRGSICWQVGNYVEAGGSFPSTFSCTRSSKISVLRCATESSGHSV